MWWIWRYLERAGGSVEKTGALNAPVGGYPLPRIQVTRTHNELYIYISVIESRE